MKESWSDIFLFISLSSRGLSLSPLIRSRRKLTSVWLKLVHRHEPDTTTVPMLRIISTLSRKHNKNVNGCVQQKKLLCNCCKIREPDWCMLLILTESRSIHQSDSRILQQLQSSFSCWTQPMSQETIGSSLCY